MADFLMASTESLPLRSGWLTGGFTDTFNVFTSLADVEKRLDLTRGTYPTIDNEEPSVLGGSAGPRYKARPFLTYKISFQYKQNTPANHPGPVSPPHGDGSQ